MPTTDTFFQIIDRAAVARLKAFHYGEDGNTPAATLAQEQADALVVAGEIYLYECLTGQRTPMVRPHLRYHDHGKVEGKWDGKSATDGSLPATVMEAAGALAEVHARYWHTQSRLQALKKLIDHHPDDEGFKATFVEQQRQIDLCNQRRNELVNHGDALFAKAVSRGS